MDNSAPPTVTISVDQENTICDPAIANGGVANGQLTATVTGAPDDDYTFTWYFGDEGDVAGSTQITSGVTTINNSTIIIDNALATDGASEISQLPEGSYWVLVEDTGSGTGDDLGCTTTASVELAPDFTDVVLDDATVIANATDKTHCSADGTNDNGSITIAIANITGSTADINDYTITLDGSTTASSDGDYTPTTSPLTISGLTPDVYNIVITDEATGCVSQNYQVTIGQDGIEPTISVSSTDDNFCTGGNGTISLDVTAPDGDETDYDFQWYTGNDDTGTNFLGGTNEFAAANLDAGDYTIVVTALNSADDGRECATTVQVTIEDDPYVLDLAATGTDLEDCEPNDGVITINSLTLTSVEDGATVLTTATTPDIDIADITYTLYSDEDLTTTVASTTGDVATEFNTLNAGTYYLTAEYTAGTTAPGCVSSAVQIVLEDNSVTPIIVITEDQANTFCSGSTTYDGQLTAVVDESGFGGSASETANYNFQWYMGEVGDMSTAIGTTSTITGLQEGEYWVEVSDTSNPNNGCIATASFILTHDPGTVEITASTSTNDTNCAIGNGTIDISEVTLTRLGADTQSSTAATIDTDYTLEYFDESLASLGNFTATAGISGLEAGIYYVTATHNTYECVSATLEFEILDATVFPELSSTIEQNNTSCDDPASADGSITLEVLTGGSFTTSSYTFTWYDGSSAASGTLRTTGGTGTGSSADPHVLTGLDDGDYTVVIEDGDNSCSSEYTFTIEDEQNIPTLNINVDNVAHNSRCDAGNGSIVIDAADINGRSADLTDYQITIAGTNTMDDDSTYTPTGSSLTIANLDVDTYLITVTDVSTTCPSSSVEIEILDESSDPSLELISLTPNQNCGGTGSIGAITISADGEDHTSGNYTFQWYNGSTTTNTVNSVYGVTDTEATLSEVPDGLYTVVVTNITGSANNGCATTQTFEITNEEVGPIVTSFTANNNTICASSNGSFELFTATLDGTEIDSTVLENDYILTVYTDAGATNAIADGNPANGQLLYDSLSGSSTGLMYYAVLQSATSLCTSDTVEFTIFDNPLNPVVAINVVQADSTCTATPGTGLLVATGDGQGDDNSDYSFEWFDSDGNSISTNDTLSQVFAGTYQVQVSSANSGCSATASATIENVPQSPEIIDFTVDEATTCNPGNGILTITGLSIATVDRYRFDFFDENPLSGSPTALQSSSSNVFDFAMPGVTYFAIAVDTLTGCTTNALQVTFGDENVVLPVLAIEDFNNQENCDPGNMNGSISVSADGSTDNTIYTFLWTDVDGNVIEANNATVSGLAAGIYTVTASNNTTGCSVTDTYEIVDDIPPFVLTPTAEANTSCTNPNGSTGVTVVPVGSGQANANTVVREARFYWFNNAEDARPDNLANADHVGETYPDLAAGTYTVIAQDVNDLFCFSEVASIEVLDETVTPVFAALVDRNLTVCFVDAPNGFAVIDTTMDISNLDFQWFEGADTSGDPFQSGLFADSLTIGSYTVLATDRVSGCFATQTIDVMDERPEIAAPTLILHSGRTHCIDPDGFVTANSAGQTEDFEFRWYAADDPETLLFTGSEITTLDTITYEVVAYNISTGCESARSFITVPNEITDPEFTVVVTQSLCLRTEDGSTNQFSGQAFVAIEDFGVFVDSVTYLDEFGDIILARRGSETLIDAGPGDYTVNFRASNGCDYSASFTIAAEIQIYNGVSANDDGFNDFFLIDCLDFFENNNVQIFNRDGVKVYEIDNYDNNVNRFNGVSNIGATQNLPAGTYFYIIDRGDGSDLIQGFLELVR